MKRSLSISPLAICILLCTLSLQTAAQQTPDTPGVIRINVNLVQVDAVVTDSSGKPVTNLTANDFVLEQDGKAQKITAFEFVRVRDPLRPLDPTTLTLPRNAAPPPATGLGRDDIRRTVALVVDDLALSAVSITRIRESLKKWIDNEMQSGDLVAIVRTDAGTGALQQFSNDKRLLYAAIDQIKYQPGRVGAAGMTQFGPASPVDTLAFDDEVENAYLRMSFNAVHYVIRGLRDLPGRKSLVLFSESMRLMYLDNNLGSLATRSTTEVTREDNLRRLADEANRSSVVVYGVDPRGPVYTGVSAEDNGGNRSVEEEAAVFGARSLQLTESQDGMAILSQKTGGMFFNSGDIAESVRRAVDDGNGYYLLGYQPEGDTFNSSNPDKFHNIKLRTKRSGLSVRSRTGFFGMPDTQVASQPQTRAAQMAKALASPFTTSALNVKMTALFSQTEKQGSLINVLLYLDAHDLKFNEEPDGSHSALIDLGIVTHDENGQISANVDKSWRLSYTKSAYDEVLKTGIVYSTTVPIKKPGPYLLRIALRDANSEKLGSATQFVEIPDMKDDRLVMSGIVMSAATGGNGNEDIGGTPAVRNFRSGSTISYAYEILNSRQESKPRLQAQIRLFREGQLVYLSPQSPLQLDSKPDAKRSAITGQLALTKVSPGTYVMQIVVSDPQRKDRAAMATQAMDFQVKE